MIAIKNNDNEIHDQKIIDQIRCLGIDMIHEANSGHPGIVLSAAPLIYTVFARHMNISPSNPDFFNRDRFIMSAGHGSALLYATLHMAGYNIEIEDLKKFRKIDSITPGHPEYKVTPGVDMTTGPLGQGFASAVGVAMGEAHLESIFNKKDKIIDFYTYVLCGDGDLMEGVSYEAASLAGTLKLNKLIVLYDSNNICLDGKTNLTFNDNIKERFTSLGWNHILVDSDNSLDEINKAIEDAKKGDKPTIIEVKTVLGKYSKWQGTNEVHGKPLEVEDISMIKKKLGFRDVPFLVTSDTIEDFQYLIQNRCKDIVEDFNDKIENLDDDLKEKLEHFINRDYYVDFSNVTYEIPESRNELLRDSAGKILSSLVKQNDILFGGSADLFGACKNYVEDGGNFHKDDYSGKNIYFGVREHAMGSILNGLALVGFRPYGSTFLSFSDYLKAPLRLSCMMDLPVTYIFTHDSITVGEDGPTHQPIEQLASLRLIPNLDVYRPADANEVLGVYQTICETNNPAAICITRNKVDVLENTKISEVKNGAYTLVDYDNKLDAVLMATGEEVHTAIELSKRLFSKGLHVRVVSVPSIKRFLNTPREYQEEVLPIGIPKIALEAGSSYSWNKLIFRDKYILSIDNFGVSGSASSVKEKFSFDIDSLEKRIENLL